MIEAQKIKTTKSWPVALEKAQEKAVKIRQREKTFFTFRDGSQVAISGMGVEITQAPLVDFGCIVKIESGTLFYAPIGEGGQMVGDWAEVSAPDQGLLDAVNTVFETGFSLTDFAGR